MSMRHVGGILTRYPSRRRNTASPLWVWPSAGLHPHTRLAPGYATQLRTSRPSPLHSRVASASVSGAVSRTGCRQGTPARRCLIPHPPTPWHRDSAVALSHPFSPHPVAAAAATSCRSEGGMMLSSWPRHSPHDRLLRLVPTRPTTNTRMGECHSHSPCAGPELSGGGCTPLRVSPPHPDEVPRPAHTHDEHSKPKARLQVQVQVLRLLGWAPP